MSLLPCPAFFRCPSSLSFRRTSPDLTCGFFLPSMHNNSRACVSCTLCLTTVLQYVLSAQHMSYSICCVHASLMIHSLACAACFAVQIRFAFLLTKAFLGLKQTPSLSIIRFHVSWPRFFLYNSGACLISVLLASSGHLFHFAALSAFPRSFVSKKTVPACLLTFLRDVASHIFVVHASFTSSCHSPCAHRMRQKIVVAHANSCSISRLLTSKKKERDVDGFFPAALAKLSSQNVPWRRHHA